MTPRSTPSSTSTTGDFPGEESVNNSAFQGCFLSFEDYVGRDYDSSQLDYTWLVPSRLILGQRRPRGGLHPLRPRRREAHRLDEGLRRLTALSP